MGRLALLIAALSCASASAQAAQVSEDDEDEEEVLPRADKAPTKGDKDDDNAPPEDGDRLTENEEEEGNETERPNDEVPKTEASSSEQQKTPPEQEDGQVADAEADLPPGEAVTDARRLLSMTVGDFRLSPLALVQLHAIPYVGDDSLVQTGDAGDRGGFRMRHARLGLDGAYSDQARVRVSVELASVDDSGVGLHDGYVGYTPFEFAQLYAGAQTVPLSRYQQIGSGRGALVERPLGVRAMGPGEQVGIVAGGMPWDGALGYWLGMFNGLQRSDRFYEGYRNNFAHWGNRLDGLTYTARLTSEPLGRLALTVADEDKGPARIGAGAGYMFSNGGGSNVHSATGDAQLQWAGLHLLAGVLWARSVPDKRPTTTDAEAFEVTSLSFAVDAGYMIIARMLGVAARFEWIDANGHIEDETDNWLFTGGASLQLVDRLLRVQAEYTHREERFGLSLANDSAMLSLQGSLEAPPRRGHGD